MKQDIRMAAILERDGRLFLVRERPEAPWELPGGPLPLDNDDIDDAMDALLQRLGVIAPEIAEDFLQTHYFPCEGGQVVYNVYAASDWAGDPRPAPGVGGGWFGIEDLAAISVHEWAHGAILDAFGLREREDEDARIVAALGGLLNPAAKASPAPSPSEPAGTAGDRTRREAGFDVLRTLTGTADPEALASRMAARQGQLGNDIIDFALGEVWSDPAIDRKTRSLQTVAVLAALGKIGPLESHINGALNHGATPEQLVQTMRMVAVYAGFPAALEAWPVLEKVFERRGLPAPGSIA